MIIGVPKETFPGEQRVALIPDVLPSLTQAGLQVLIEPNAGRAAGLADAAYAAKGGKIAASRKEIFDTADLIVQVRTGGANPEKVRDDFVWMRKDQVIVGTCEPLSSAELLREMAESGVILFSLEMIPRITRAQRMDVLSSMATIAGYKAVLLAANALPRMFPMLMTAAGTLKPAQVLIIGAGVAGLQAIATARRLGAVVLAYDIRPAAREQIESLGAKVVSLDLETTRAQDSRGYAKAMGDSFIEQQSKRLAETIAACDVVITTAAVPGKKAPILVTEEAVRGMRPGSIVVDLAAERGGNCELSKHGEDVEFHGVHIMGPRNLPSTIPFHASQLFAKNAATFVTHLAKDGKLNIDMEDVITSDTLVTRGGYVVNPRVRELLEHPNGKADENKDL